MPDNTGADAMKKTLTAAVFFVFGLGASLQLFAQTDFDKWLADQNRRYGQFLEENDRAFVEFLKKQWEPADMDVSKKDVRPKPDVIPVAPPAPPKPDVPPPVFELPPLPLPAPEPVPPPPPPAPADIPPARDYPAVPVELDLFGFRRKVEVDAAFTKLNLDIAFNEQAIADIWESFCKMEYSPLLSQIALIRDEIKLNDWALSQMLNQLGLKLYSGRRNNHFLFVWFMLIKSGYDARIGIGQDGIHLLLSSDHTLYDVSFFTKEGRNYYAVSFDQAPNTIPAIKTYEGRYPDAVNTVGFDLPSAPVFTGNYQTRPLAFSHQGSEYAFEVQYNRGLVDFFQNHPHVDYPVYFRASLTPPARESLRSGLLPLLRGKPALAAVNLLLRFVQTAFEYATDDEQFGREKPFFAEETFFYPHSDCEDRAVLFSYLVRDLLGLDVIGLKYPEHVAAAVAIPGQVEGAKVKYNGKEYVICDPTYINADAGMVMPQFARTAPGLIPITGY